MWGEFEGGKPAPLMKGVAHSIGWAVRLYIYANLIVTDRLAQTLELD